MSRETYTSSRPARDFALRFTQKRYREENILFSEWHSSGQRQYTTNVHSISHNPALLHFSSHRIHDRKKKNKKIQNKTKQKFVSSKNSSDVQLLSHKLFLYKRKKEKISFIVCKNQIKTWSKELCCCCCKRDYSLRYDVGKLSANGNSFIS